MVNGYFFVKEAEASGLTADAASASGEAGCRIALAEEARAR